MLLRSKKLRLYTSFTLPMKTSLRVFTLTPPVRSQAFKTNFVKHLIFGALCPAVAVLPLPIRKSPK